MTNTSEKYERKQQGNLLVRVVCLNKFQHNVQKEGGRGEATFFEQC